MPSSAKSSDETAPASDCVALQIPERERIRVLAVRCTHSAPQFVRGNWRIKLSFLFFNSLPHRTPVWAEPSPALSSPAPSTGRPAVAALLSFRFAIYGLGWADPARPATSVIYKRIIIDAKSIRFIAK